MVYQKLHPGIQEDVTPSNHRLAHNPSAFLVQMLIAWVKKNI
jgi:hypothetical protein